MSTLLPHGPALYGKRHAGPVGGGAAQFAGFVMAAIVRSELRGAGAGICGRTRRPHPASPTTTPSRITIRPRTKVITGAPHVARPSNGVIRLRECSRPPAIRPGRARSTTAMSASAPGASRPLRGYRPKARAGAAELARLQLAADDLGIGPETMKHVAPLGWEHLSLTGHYGWDTTDAPRPGELRPLRTRPSLLAA